AVGPDEPDAVALAEAERSVVEDDRLAELLGQVLREEDVVGRLLHGAEVELERLAARAVGPRRGVRVRLHLLEARLLALRLVIEPVAPLDLLDDLELALELVRFATAPRFERAQRGFLLL